MNVGEAAKETGLPVKTIRYYDGIGLISPDRQENGYREFDAICVHKLHFLKRARGLGFSVEDCRILLSLYEDHERSSADVKRIALEHLSVVDKKISELDQFRRALTHLVDACKGNELPDCPILDEIAGDLPEETQH